MYDVHERWKEYPTISFEQQKLMTVNGKIVDIQDTSPVAFSDYLEIGRNEIDSQLEMLQALRKYRNLEDSRPFILVGRLALDETEDKVLELRGLMKAKDNEIEVTDLKKDFQQYWLRVESALYKPEIHRHQFLDYPSLNGMWLGLSRLNNIKSENPPDSRRNL